MYTDILQKFTESNAYCKKHKVKISKLQAHGVFNLIDTDDSGELEPDEVLDVF